MKLDHSHIFYVSTNTLEWCDTTFYAYPVFCMHRTFIVSRELSLSSSPINTYAIQHTAPRLSGTEHISLFTVLELSV
jgi:hypothetical protein